MFGVMSHALGVTMTPMRENFVAIRVVPIGKLMAGHIKAGFLEHFASAGLLGRFLQTVLATGYRLPEPGMISSFEQKHLRVGRMNNDQD